MFPRKDLDLEWLEIAGVTPDLQGPQWRRRGQW